VQSNIHVFYHIGQISNWEWIAQEQLHALQLSGLIDACKSFNVGVNGNTPLRGLPTKAVVTHHAQAEWAEETSTLKQVRDFCVAHGASAQILYLHTKGVRWNGSVSINCWRLYMEYFCVHRWRNCVDALAAYDCVGSLWAEARDWYPAHFSGNFWWANSSYIADRLNHQLLDTKNRYDREFWIGSGNPKVKSYDVADRPVLGDHFYNHIIPSEVILEGEHDG
jgi:hypothetical protein